MSKFHRDAPLPPTDPSERKKLILWLQDHPLWTYPVSVKMPPVGQRIFDEPYESEGLKRARLREPGPDWTDEIAQMGSLQECLDFDFVYVNPETECIEDDKSLNTAFRIWLEGGGWYDLSEDPNHYAPTEGWDDHNKWNRSHDTRLDCGAPDMESALIELALLVQFYYNDDGTDRGEAPDRCEFKRVEGDDYQSTCVDAGDGYCKTCGYLIDPDIPISVIIKGRIDDIDKA